MPTTRVTWLQTNRRALCVGIAVLLSLLAVAIACVVMSPSVWLRWAASASTVLLTCLLAVGTYRMFQPRLSYGGDHLHVHLRPGAPIQVPIEVVECFFLGQGPTLLPRPFGRRDKAEETSTIVVRLAESAEAWKHFDVKPAWGLWCDGYITIRGTWCEPITNELLKRLNENLIAAHRDVRARTSYEAAAEIHRAPPTRGQEVG